MSTQHITIRISPDVVVALEKFAREHEWSRNYVIGKFLKEKVYELTAGDESC